MAQVDNSLPTAKALLNYAVHLLLCTPQKHTHRGVLHATARMISGGPVYVSDKPGRHDPSLLSRLALPSSGRLLQPLLPGRPCVDVLFADVCGDGVSALKVWNLNACGGVLALFNVQVRWWMWVGCENAIVLCCCF